MKARTVYVVVVGLALVAGSVVGGRLGPVPGPGPHAERTQPRTAEARIVDRTHLALEQVVALRVPFVANEGQVPDSQVRFYARTFGGTVYVTRSGGIAYCLPGGAAQGDEQAEPAVQEPRLVHGWKLQERLVGGAASEPAGVDPAETRMNYYLGSDPSRWRSDVATYHGVSLGTAYPGIGVRLQARENSVEKLFTVAPGADPAAICVAVDGAEVMAVNQAGELEVQTGLGKVRFSKPLAYQERGGARQYVEAAYRVDGNTYSFDVPAYDPSRTLVIDPLLMATFLGGSKGETINSMAQDSAGNVYVAGYTTSPDFPVHFGVGPYTGTLDTWDAFVSEFDASLQSLNASTIIGGTGVDTARGVHVAADGSVYVVGDSDSGDLPVTQSFGRQEPWNADVFVCKLASDLRSPRLVALRGMWEDRAQSVVLTGDSLYVAGYTNSDDFPVTTDLGSQRNGVIYDAFVTKLNLALTACPASLLIGGQYTERDVTLAVDQANAVYLAGYTNSPDYPTLGAYDPDNSGGNGDAFVTALAADLSGMTASTFLGGPGWDQAQALAITADGVYVLCYTESGDFVANPVSASQADVVVCRLAANLSSLTAHILVGGNSEDWGRAMAVDAGTGDVCFTGYTNSPDYPVSEGAPMGGTDIVVTRVDRNLAGIVASGRVGGSSEDNSLAMVLGSSNRIYVGGSTSSSDFPATAGAYDWTRNPTVDGNSDAIVASLELVPGPVTTPEGPMPTSTRTGTPPATYTPTITRTPSKSPTCTTTPSRTPTPTVTRTPSPSPTLTATPSPTPSPTWTRTPSPTPTPTRMPFLMTGTVYDDSTYGPVGGATVGVVPCPECSQCEPPRVQTTSGDDGRYELGIPAVFTDTCDSLTIEVSAFGYHADRLEEPMEGIRVLTNLGYGVNLYLQPSETAGRLYLPLVLRSN